MNYPAYPEYSTPNIALGVSYPKAWPIERLRFSILSNPVRSEVADWKDDTLVSFVPMDAVGEQGGIDASQEKPIGDVYTGYTYFAEQDILIAKITPCFENGKGAIAEGLKNGVGFGTTEFHVLRPLQGISVRWMFYLTMSDAFRKIGGSQMLGAGGQKRVQEDFIKNFETGIPSYTEQQQIAAFLDWKTGQIDALIAKKKELLEKLKEKRLAVITQAVTKGLNPAAPLRDSGIPWLGQVPGHWEVKKLKFIGDSIIGLTYDPSEITDDLNGTLVLRANNIQGGKLVANDALYVSTEAPEKLRLRSDDILICSRNGSRHLIGKCGRVTPEFIGCYFGAFNTVFRSAATDYIFHVLNSSLFEFQSGSYLTSTINQLTIGTLNSFVVPLPPPAEQKQIAKFLEAETMKLDELASNVQSAIDRLTEYRTALITAATTGKIDVRQVSIPSPA